MHIRQLTACDELLSQIFNCEGLYLTPQLCVDAAHSFRRSECLELLN